jgi:hypothetical protein
MPVSGQYLYEMMLLDHIKRDRARQRGKQTLPETVFSVVAAIVQKFNLQAVPGGEGRGLERLETNPGGRLSLFPLLSADQWRLTKNIIEKYDNPLLVYARSPQDFGLSRWLYERRPDLPVEVMKEFSLAALWMRESAGELGNLVKNDALQAGNQKPGTVTENSETKGTRHV